MPFGKAGIFGTKCLGRNFCTCNKVGAAIILVGTSFVGLIVLFNTSIDAVFKIAKAWWATNRGFIFGTSQMKIGGIGAKSLSKGH